MTDAPTPDARADTADYEVPAGETPHRCARCGAPFADEQLLALHRGLEHAADLSATERTAHEEALEAEQAAVRRFRLVALGALVVLYFGLLVTYALVA
ncbi:MAG: C2H2-type zinc finger protein [Halorientalis sp.]